MENVSRCRNFTVDNKERFTALVDDVNTELP